MVVNTQLRTGMAGFVCIRRGEEDDLEEAMSYWRDAPARFDRTLVWVGPMSRKKRNRILDTICTSGLSASPLRRRDLPRFRDRVMASAFTVPRILAAVAMQLPFLILHLPVRVVWFALGRRPRHLIVDGVVDSDEPPPPDGAGDREPRNPYPPTDVSGAPLPLEPDPCRGAGTSSDMDRRLLARQPSRPSFR